MDSSGAGAADEDALLPKYVGRPQSAAPPTCDAEVASGWTAAAEGVQHHQPLSPAGLAPRFDGAAAVGMANPPPLLQARNVEQDTAGVYGAARVQVKNTFIELQDPDPISPGAPAQRKGRHRRVTSEPFGPTSGYLSSFASTSASSIDVSSDNPWLAAMVPEDMSSDASRGTPAATASGTGSVVSDVTPGPSSDFQGGTSSELGDVPVAMGFVETSDGACSGSSNSSVTAAAGAAAGLSVLPIPKAHRRQPSMSMVTEGEEEREDSSMASPDPMTDTYASPTSDVDHRSTGSGAFDHAHTYRNESFMGTAVAPGLYGSEGLQVRNTFLDYRDNIGEGVDDEMDDRMGWRPSLRHRRVTSEPMGPMSVQMGRQDSLAMGRQDSLAMGRQDSLAMGRQDSRLMGRQDSLHMGRQDSLQMGRQDSTGAVSGLPQDGSGNAPQGVPWNGTMPAHSRPKRQAPVASMTIAEGDSNRNDDDRSDGLSEQEDDAFDEIVSPKMEHVGTGDDLLSPKPDIAAFPSPMAATPGGHVSTTAYSFGNLPPAFGHTLSGGAMPPGWPPSSMLPTAPDGSAAPAPAPALPQNLYIGAPVGRQGSGGRSRAAHAVRGGDSSGAAMHSGTPATASRGVIGGGSSLTSPVLPGPCGVGGDIAAANAAMAAAAFAAGCAMPPMPYGAHGWPMPLPAQLTPPLGVPMLPPGGAATALSSPAQQAAFEAYVAQMSGALRRPQCPAGALTPAPGIDNSPVDPTGMSIHSPGAASSKPKSPATSAGEATPSTNASRSEMVPCKWFTRGTCKFGAECRFDHTRLAESARAVASISTVSPSGSFSETKATAAAGSASVTLPLASLTVKQQISTQEQSQDHVAVFEPSQPQQRQKNRGQRRRERQQSHNQLQLQQHQPQEFFQPQSYPQQPQPQQISPQSQPVHRGSPTYVPPQARTPPAQNCPPARGGGGGRDARGGEDGSDDDDDDGEMAVGSAKSVCHVIWCDPRAFKDNSEALRLQLQASAQGAPIKAHKTAEKCMRLLRKKRQARERSGATRPASIYLVSWANAPALVPYLDELRISAEKASAAGAFVTKVILLCDLCGHRGRESASRLEKQYSDIVISVAPSWEQALDAVAAVTNSFQTG